jgi:hypothetical protein
VLSLFLCVARASAQAQASLQGRVFDASGAVVEDAVVRVSNGSVAFDTAARTDAEGRYAVFAIPARAYAVLAEAPGSGSIRRRSWPPPGSPRCREMPSWGFSPAPVADLKVCATR